MASDSMSRTRKSTEQEQDLGTEWPESPSSSIRPHRPPLNTSPESQGRRRSVSFRSPSSPDVTLQDMLPRSPTMRKLSRSKTLPRTIESPTRRRMSELDGLHFEPEMITRLRRWILCLVLVDFDLDIGPVVRGCCPPLHLSTSELENIAFSSFPDSLQFEEGSQCHSFRISESCGESSTANPRRPTSQDGFFYGWSYFTQRKDSTSKRGFRQQSLVILTHLQYPALFCTLSSRLGPLYQSHKIPMLEAACFNIANWSDPKPGSTLELGFLGSVLPTELPLTSDHQQLAETTSFREKYDPRLHILACAVPFAPPPINLFQASLSHLWSIWECLVLGEPILVFAPNPAMTSQAIWWFRDLLRPISVAGDLRPYFTIHDPDYFRLVNKLAPKHGLILGVTNPMFEKSCSHWPHVLSLGRPLSEKPRSTPGPPSGWKTKTHKRYTSKDRPLLQRLEDACKGDENARIEASLTLRRHFCSRTTAFLVPLHRYLNTLIPSPAEFSAAQRTGIAPRLGSFNSQNFFASLKTHGSPLPFRSSAKQKEFYTRWLRAPAFGMWLASQEEIVQRVLQKNTENVV